MIQKIKSYFFNKKLLELSFNNKSNRRIINLHDAKKIGIVFDASEFKNIQAVREYELKFKHEGKDVQIFGYINSNEKKYEPFLITNKDLNWYGLPIKKSLQDFSDTNFDILFGFFIGIDSPLNSVFASSKAKLRVGIDYGQSNILFDLIIKSANIKNHTDSIQPQINFLTQVTTS